ncbi:phosphotransferase family protein [Lapillicoccus jejuensis]|uniref:Aminoglycoside phosphotransferase (APT) family kinase protein n=1 Tax=Lapillicoccus jejuensis TaxID=402171 RepID=A0A542DXK1_9MICO|nr:phosphotransferase family protein [Lapillicoccus jejuensis]TQJ07654.1 aminoglycoside phosphotransferase (APT) family kinase protein [Lapillicoccus jejuensis]
MTDPEAPYGDPPGLDLTALRRWLDDAAPGLLDGPLTAQVVAGGKSNLTYRVTDGTTRVVVRRPPLGHVLATAHDMGREHRVMTALAPTPVPVPRTYAQCTDDSVVGAPFYVMEHVDGTPYRTREELEALGPERTRAISERMVDTLADLHLVDPDEVGLRDFGRPEGFLARQVRRWGQQLDASRSRELAGSDALRARLAAGVPRETPPAIVHGDYRLDNILTDDADRMAAVVDWEMATLGDPLTDVALLLTYQRVAARGAGGVSTVSLAPGYLTEDELAQRYAARTGRDLDHLGFYEGLACFKLAVILEGIHYRFVQGQTVGEGFSRVGEMTEPLLALGHEAMDRLDADH